MAEINPPQFEADDTDAIRLYKHRQFVEDVIRGFQQINREIAAGGGGGGGSGSSSGGYPAQLGYAGVR